MREFDSLGLQLAKSQGRIFEESLTRYSGSSAIFIRNYMWSKEVWCVDRQLEFDSARILESIENKRLDIGKVKYSPDEIYWIGYIYRYWAYIYETNSKRIYKVIGPDELRKRYVVYHTMDPKAAIDRILEEKGVNMDMSFERQYQLYIEFNKRKEEEAKRSKLKSKL